MRTLSAGLLAAQAANTQAPIVAFAGFAEYAGLPIWQQGVYGDGTGFENGARYQAACISGDGFLVRIVNDAGTIKVKKSTLANANIGAWTTIVTGASLAPIAVEQDGAVIRIFYWTTSRTVIACYYSTTNGASWFAGAVYTLPAGRIGWMLAASYGVHVRVLFSTQASATAGASNDADIRLVYFNGASWVVVTLNAPGGFAHTRGLGLSVIGAVLFVYGATDKNLGTTTAGPFQNLVRRWTIADSATPTWNTDPLFVDEGSTDSTTTWALGVVAMNGKQWLARVVNITPLVPEFGRLVVQRANSGVNGSIALSPAYPIGANINVGYDQSAPLVSYGAGTLTTLGSYSYHLLGSVVASGSLPVLACTLEQSLMDESLSFRSLGQVSDQQIRVSMGYGAETVLHSIWWVGSTMQDQRTGMSETRCYGPWGVLEREILLADRVYTTAAGLPLPCGDVLKLLLGILNIDTAGIGLSVIFYPPIVPLWTLRSGSSLKSLVLEVCQFCGVVPRLSVNSSGVLVFGWRHLADLNTSPTTLVGIDAEYFGENEEISTAVALKQTFTDAPTVARRGYERLAVLSDALRQFGGTEMQSAIWRGLLATTATAVRGRVNVALEPLDTVTGFNILAYACIHRLAIGYAASGEWEMQLELGDVPWSAIY